MRAGVFLATAPSELNKLADAEDPLDEAALAIADRYVREWLVIWCRSANADTPAAPSTRSMLESAEVERMKIPAHLRQGPAGTAASSRGRSWAQRLRVRWCGRHAALPVADRLPPAGLNEKVCCVLCARRHGELAPRFPRWGERGVPEGWCRISGSAIRDFLFRWADLRAGFRERPARPAEGSGVGPRYWFSS